MNQFPFPGREACLEELRRDRLYDRIPAGDRDRILHDAWTRGEAAAARYLPQGVPIREVLERAGFQIVREDRDQVLGNTRYFAEFREKSGRITLYTGSIHLWCDHNQVPYDTGEALILAHEYFHCLERQVLPSPREVYTLPLFQIGPWRFGQCGLTCVSEIGAHAFSAAYGQRLQSPEKP